MPKVLLKLVKSFH